MAPNDDPSRAFGYNIKLWIDSDGAYTLGSQGQFYPWTNNEELWETSPVGQPIDLEKLKKIQAYPILDRWQINMRVRGMK